MVNKISINESETIITKVEIGIVTNEILHLIEIKLGNVINHQKDWSYLKLVDVISIEQAKELIKWNVHLEWTWQDYYRFSKECNGPKW